MTHHYDFQDKTKAERRERGREKKKERMDAGKRTKLLHRLAMERAGVPLKEAGHDDDNGAKTKGGGAPTAHS